MQLTFGRIFSTLSLRCVQKLSGKKKQFSNVYRAFFQSFVYKNSAGNFCTHLIIHVLTGQIRSFKTCYLYGPVLEKFHAFNIEASTKKQALFLLNITQSKARVPIKVNGYSRNFNDEWCVWYEWKRRLEEVAIMSIGGIDNNCLSDWSHVENESCSPWMEPRWEFNIFSQIRALFRMNPFLPDLNLVASGPISLWLKPCWEWTLFFLTEA